MYLAVKNVQPISNYQLILTFSNAEIRQFDMKPYIQTGIFQELKDVSLFNTVRVSFDTIEWDNNADIDPKILYKDSVAIENQLASEPKSEYKNIKE